MEGRKKGWKVGRTEGIKKVEEEGKGGRKRLEGR